MSQEARTSFRHPAGFDMLYVYSADMERADGTAGGCRYDICDADGWLMLCFLIDNAYGLADFSVVISRKFYAGFHIAGMDNAAAAVINCRMKELVLAVC